MSLQEFWQIFPMAQEQHKPFTQTELKILVFNKVKKGYSYKQAIELVEKEIDMCLKNHKEYKDQESSKNKTFKEEFSKLIHGKKR